MSYFIVDVEADGPYPIDYSMISIGIVKVTNKLDCTFYSTICPISDKWIPDALSISGFSRKECEQFKLADDVMDELLEWVRVNSNGTPVMLSDNPAFDWQFVNSYFHMYCNTNPFGFSARRIGDLYCGAVRNQGANKEWKRKFRKTKHTHNALDDAIGNAEALLKINDLFQLKFNFT